MSDDEEYDPAGVTAKVVVSEPPARRPPRVEIQALPPVVDDGDDDVLPSFLVSGRAAAAATTSVTTPAPSTSHTATAKASYFPCLSGTRVVRLRGHDRPIRSLAVSPSGDCLVTASGDGSLNMWDYADVAGRADWSAIEKRHDYSSLKASRSIKPFLGTITTQNQPVSAVAWLADGRHFVACEDGPKSLVIRREGKTLQSSNRGSKAVDPASSNGHLGGIRTCAAHPTDADRFATGAADSTVRVWSVAKLEVGSIYAARHGQGSVADPVTVHATTWLTTSASMIPLLASAGSDGIVQLWSTTQPFAPKRSAVTVGANHGEVGADGMKPIALSVERLPWSEHVLVVRYSDSTVRFFDVRGALGVEAFPRLSGVTVAGESAPLLISATAGELIVTASLSTLADLRHGEAVDKGTYALRVVRSSSGAPAVGSAHLVVPDTHVTAATVHVSSGQLFVGDHRGFVHAVMCPTGSAVQGDVSWVTCLRGASRRANKHDDASDDEGQLPTFMA